MTNKRGIEFLPKAPPTRLEKAVTLMAKTAGIPLIIGIQIIFLALLGLHLKLEHDLATLAVSVAEKEERLAQAEELENLFRATQSKLETIATVKEGLCYSCALKTLNQVTPPLISFTTFTLEGEKSSFAAETSHGPSFALFVANLIEEKAIKEAAITSGSLSREGRFAFAMELLFDKALLTND